MSKTLFGKHQLGSIARGGTWALSYNMLRGIFQLSSAIVLSRLISPDHFGVFAVMLVFHALVTSILGNSLSTSLIQKPDLEEQEASNFLWFTASVSGGIAILFAALGPVISYVFNDAIYVPFAIAFAGLIWLDAVGAQYQALAMRSIRFDILFKVQILSAPIALAAGIWAAMEGFGPWALLVHMAFSSVLARLLLVAMIGWLPLLFSRATKIGGMVNFGALVSLANLTGLAYNRLPILFLTNLAGPSAAGYFNRGDGLFNRPFEQAVYPISVLLLPSMSAASSNLDRLRDLLNQSIWLLALALGPLIASIVAFGDWYAVLLLGPAWVEAGEVVRWMAVMATTTIFRTSLSSINAALGRPARAVGLKLGLLPIFILLLCWAAPRGAGYTAMIMAVFYVAMAPMHIAVLMRGLPIRMFPILKVFASAYAVLIGVTVTLFGLRGVISHLIDVQSPTITDYVVLFALFGGGYLISILLSHAFPSARAIVQQLFERLVLFVRTKRQSSFARSSQLLNKPKEKAK